MIARAVVLCSHMFYLIIAVAQVPFYHYCFCLFVFVAELAITSLQI